jgi:hypothetical protein
MTSEKPSRKGRLFLFVKPTSRHRLPVEHCCLVPDWSNPESENIKNVHRLTPATGRRKVRQLLPDAIEGDIQWQVALIDF